MMSVTISPAMMNLIVAKYLSENVFREGTLPRVEKVEQESDEAFVVTFDESESE